MPRTSGTAVASALAPAGAALTALAGRIESLARASELGQGAARAGGAGALIWRPGWPELEAALPGGVPRGQVTEWAGPRSAGKTAGLRQLVRSVWEDGAGAAYVDGTGTLSPAPWAGWGSEGPPFWVVRPPDPLGVLTAAEELLRSGVFGLVVVEGADWSRTPVIRLQRLARKAGAALVAVVDRAGRVPLAGLRVEFSAQTSRLRLARFGSVVSLPSSKATSSRTSISSSMMPLSSHIRRRVLVRGRGLSHEVVYIHELPYRLPEDCGFPDRRAPAG